jgi:hypothetical protein
MVKRPLRVGSSACATFCNVASPFPERNFDFGKIFLRVV